MYPDLKGKTVVVTGASAGLGHGIAQRFLAAGSQVVLVGRSAITWLTDTDRDNCEHIQCDIRDTAPVEHWLNEWEKAGKSVHVLVNNAGVIEEGALLEYSQEAWDSTFDVNLKATFSMCQLFAKHMRDKQDGSIVNAASYAATLPAAYAIVHLAARAGVRPSIREPALYAEVNLTGTSNVLEMAREYSIRNFVFASSSSVYGERQQTPFKEEDPGIPEIQEVRD